MRRNSAHWKPAVFAASPAATPCSTRSASTKAGELFGVFVQRTVGDKLEIAMAERAIQRGAGQAEQTFVLFDGRRYEGVPGTPTWRVIEFKEHGITVRLPDLKRAKSKEELQADGRAVASEQPRDRAELAWRTAVPVMAVVLMVLAVPLAKLRPRQGRFARVGTRRAGLFHLFEPAGGRAGLDRERIAGRAVRPLVGAPACRCDRGLAAVA